jgi:hypothetical protein
MHDVAHLGQFSNAAAAAKRSFGILKASKLLKLFAKAK